MAITSSGSSKIGGTSLTVVIDPKRTYLKTNSDPSSSAAIPIDLVALGIAAGDVLALQQRGDYDTNGASAGGVSANMVGVFSTSAAITAATNLNRVTGATAAPNPVFGGNLSPYATQNTATGNLATDISLDFKIGSANDGVTITQVPTGVGFLFVSPDDNAFGGNTDLNNNYGLNIYRPMVAGLSGVGSVTVTGGTEYRDAVSVGAGIGSNGTLTVTSGAVFNIGGAATPDGLGDTVDGRLAVGVAGTGLATINGGSVVTVTANGTYQNIEAGIYAGSTGTITVTGAGSQLVAAGVDAETHIGVYGTGTLNVLAGGSVETLGLFAGIRDTGAGTVNVSGSGSTLTVSNDNGYWSENPAAYGGFASFGGRETSAGFLNITNGGVMEVRNSTTESGGGLRFARNLTSTGTGVVDGVGSELNILRLGAGNLGYGGPQLIVGHRGDATLTVSNGGEVNIIGHKAELVVSSAFSNGDESATSIVAQSELLIQSGAVVTIDHGTNTDYFAVQVGAEQFGNGAIRMTGSGSLLQTLGTQDGIAIGNRGVGLMTVETGADVTSQMLFIGNDEGSTGTVTVDGAGSSIVLSSPGTYDPAVRSAGLWVGNRGSGTMTVSNSATVTLTGANAEVHVGDGYGLGAPGASGELNIVSGGVVSVDHGATSPNTATLQIGQSEFAVGTVNISGNGSRFESLGNNNLVFVGNEGIGALNILAGGDLTALSMEVGSRATGNGTVVVDGTGSGIALSGPATYDYAVGRPQLIVGNEGQGTLTVRNNATVMLSGGDATLHVGANFGVGVASGSGILNIESGAVVTVDHGVNSYNNATIMIGTDNYASGTVNVSGAGSQLVSQGGKNEIVVGDRGNGYFNVTNGAVVSALRMFVASDETATGAVTVDGVGSAINLIGPNLYDPAIQNPGLWVGNRGTATMVVSNNAQVNITGGRASLFVGDGYGAVGPGETGTMTIQSGADVTVTTTDPNSYGGNVNIGTQVFGSGTLTVTGAGSTLTAAGASPSINVGNQGTGVLNVLAGGLVKSLRMTVGDQNGSNGDLNIGGAGSKVLLSNDTHTGGGPGDTYAGGLTVGNNAGSYGRADISAGGVLEIRNSADTTQDAPGLGIGNENGAVGVVTVTGTGSAINIIKNGDAFVGAPGEYGPSITVGWKGDGSLTASNNAQINLTGEAVWFQVSRGHNDGEIGAPARTSLSEVLIESGADLNLNASGGTYYGAGLQIGSRTNANGRFIVDGTGSTVNVNGNNVGDTYSATAYANVGNRGYGELIVRNGGDMFINGGDDKRPELNIGRNANSLGSVLVTGAGSSINILTSNATANGGGIIYVGRNAGSEGSLTIENGGQVINDLGSTNSAMVVGRGGAFGGDPAAVGTVMVDGNGNTATLLDAGQLLVVGAGFSGVDSTLGSVGFFGGGTGSVAVLDGATVRANEIAVGQYGTISGNATFDGNVTVNGGGIIAPGASPGKMTITGALNVIDGTLNMEGNGLTAGTQYDQIKVNGAVTLGTVDINLNVGMTLARGNTFVLIDGDSTLSVDLSQVAVNVTGASPNLGFLLGDTGGDLIFEALDNNGVGTAVVKFGSTSTIGAIANLNADSGLGTGTGGRFDSVRYVNASGLEGTAVNDSLTLLGVVGGTLNGKAGNDVLKGGGGVDTLTGEAGTDTLNGGAGNDTLNGGTENDTLRGEGNDDTLNGDDGVDQLFGGSGNDTMNGGLGNDTLEGQGNNDTLHGDDGNDLIRGADGIDTLFGDAGDDNLNGGAGGDTLNGGTGNDILNGTADTNQDKFIFMLNYDLDQINSYEQGIDRLRLDDALWLDTHPAITTGQQVIDTFGVQGPSNKLVLDFGNGDVLTIVKAGGAFNLATLGLDVQII